MPQQAHVPLLGSLEATGVLLAKAQSSSAPAALQGPEKPHTLQVSQLQEAAAEENIPTAAGLNCIH